MLWLLRFLKRETELLTGRLSGENSKFVTQKWQSFYPEPKNVTLTLNIHASTKTTPVARLTTVFSLTNSACIVLLPIAGFEKLALCPLTRPYLILKRIKESGNECEDWIFNWCRTRSGDGLLWARRWALGFNVVNFLASLPICDQRPT